VPAEETLIVAVENAIRNVSLRFAGETVAGDDHAVVAIAAGQEASSRIDRWSDVGIVVSRAEECLVTPQRVVRHHHAISHTVLEHELRIHPPLILREPLE